MKRSGRSRPACRALAVLWADGRDAGDELGAFDVDAAVALAQRQQFGRELAVHRRQRGLVLFAVVLRWHMQAFLAATSLCHARGMACGL